MSNSAATEGSLGLLHAATARIMLQALKRYEDLDMDDIVIGADNGSGMVSVSIPEPSAALLGAITKFLKDNNITCQIDASSEMSDLEKRLQAKGDTTGKVVQLRTVTPVAAEPEIDDDE
jgi:NADPH:quinone reductase-like Zn-dependent oxidoreductase